MIFAPEKVETIITEWSEVMAEPIRCNFKRFSITENADDAIENEKKQIMDFCANRPQTIKTMYKYFFE